MPHYIEDIPQLYCARTTLADRRARGTEDKTVGQCCGDLGVSVDSPTTFGCRYYRALLLAAASTLSTACVREEPPPQENTSELLAPTASLRGAEAVDSRRPGKTSPDLEETRIFLTHLPPFVAFRAGQSFAIEHHRARAREEVQVSAFPRSRGSGRRQAPCGFRAGGLWSARPGRSALPGILAEDLVSFPYFTFSWCPNECHFREA